MGRNIVHEIPFVIESSYWFGKDGSHILAPFLSQFIDNRFHIAPRMIVGE
jgi:hypothetical protein